MNELNKLKKKLDKARKDLIRTSMKTRKYLAINPLKVCKTPKGWNFQQMKKDYEARNKAERKYKELLRR